MITINPRYDLRAIASFLGGDLYYNSKVPPEQLKAFYNLITQYYLPKLEQVAHKNEHDIVQEALQGELFARFKTLNLAHYEKDELESGYKQNYFERKIQGEVDFVLKGEKNLISLFEVKKPNSAEMISADNVNKTALHEVILYYLREKERAFVQGARFELHYIIITDFYQFFFFKESEFERYFYKDEFIKSLYDRHKSLIKSDLAQDSKRNIDFYAELKAYLGSEHFGANLTPLHLDLARFKSEDSSDLSYIKPFFKAFSPEFLLDRYIHKNEINEAFYKELLYILGLKVLDGAKDKNKNTIIPNNVSGTLYHNIVDTLVNKADKTQENIISLIIVWLNRILFLKLIEANLVRFSTQSSDKKAIRFLNNKHIKDFQSLEHLFFEVFAKPHEIRDKDSPFFTLPYLNSSLFNPSQIEQKLIHIRALSNDKELVPYKEQDKKSPHKAKIPLLRYLLDFLDSYDFGSGEEYEADTLINASILGNVFERVNAYKDGSFYTPSAITGYMCKESLESVVIERFNEANPAWHCKNLADIESEILQEMRKSSDREAIKQKHIALLKSIHICDPAVGSGHFLVSALNAMIKIYYDLGLLDSSILSKELHIIGDEVILSDFVYSNPKSPNEPHHKTQKALFNLKKSIIESNLFGVDINPNSVEICKLRLWIELLKNSYYLTQGENDYITNLDSRIHQMQTLPNIDINIKRGNSLVANFTLDSTFSKVQTKAFSQNLKATIIDYKAQVALYKDALAQKSAITDKIHALKSLLKNYLISDSGESKRLIEHLRQFVVEYGEKHFDIDSAFGLEILRLLNKVQKETAGFRFQPTMEQLEPKALDKNGRDLLAKIKADFEALESLRNGDSFEWRFEFPEVLNEKGDFMGFDLIIGNPPYGDLLSKANKEFCKKRYKYADTGDTYKLFIEKGFDLIKIRGNLGYIVPLSVTSSKSNIALHKMLLENCEFIKVSSYGHRPIKVFPNAEQRVSVISAIKTMSKTKHLMTTKINRRYASQSLKELMETMDFVDSLDFVKEGAFCKIGLEIEKSIMQKLYSHKQTLKSLMKGKGRIYYRTTGGGYYDLYTSYPTQSSKEKYFNVKNGKLLTALMSSSLFWWFRNAYSNGRDSYKYEFERFPVPKFSKEIIAKLGKLATRYESDIEKNHDFSNGVKTYKIRKSKHIIDEIDKLICPLYGLSKQEMEFIINYEIEFRTD